MATKSAAKPTQEKLSPQELMKVINKKMGFDAVSLANEDKFTIERIPFGILSVDDVLGGGAPRGRYVELYGANSLCKTTLFLRLIAMAQRNGENCFWLDPEKSFDKNWAIHNGVNVDDLILVQDPIFGDEYFDIGIALLRSGEFGVGICDSIASLYPQQEDDKPVSKLMPGTQARLMSKGLRHMTAVNKKTCLGFINQTRQTISMFTSDTTSGGKAMSFYAGVRIELRQLENIKKKMRVFDPKSGEYGSKDVIIGRRVLVKVTKDKTGGAVQETTGSFVFDNFNGTFDHIEDLIMLGKKYEIITKRGMRWNCGRIRGASRDELKSKISENSKFVRQLEKAISKRIQTAGERIANGESSPR